MITIKIQFIENEIHFKERLYTKQNLMRSKLGFPIYWFTFHNQHRLKQHNVFFSKDLSVLLPAYYDVNIVILRHNKQEVTFH